MSIPNNLCWTQTFANIWATVRLRRISYRLLGFITAAFLTLCTLYSPNISRLALDLSGKPNSPPTHPEVWAERAVHVKKAFIHAYRGYELYAAPHDELRPISNRASDTYVF
jgi:hypothetical protein